MIRDEEWQKMCDEVFNEYKAMPNGKKKYQAYLQSQDWELKREEIYDRSCGVCERCYRYLGKEVHHLTYARLYNERLEDLQHLCSDCHAFVERRGSVDHMTEPLPKYYCSLCRRPRCMVRKRFQRVCLCSEGLFWEGDWVEMVP